MKKILSHLILILFLTSCQKEITREQLPDEVASVSANAKGQSERILICHHKGPGSWQLKSIFLSDWPVHAAHGDVRLDDQDKDGYVPVNPCEFGQMGDCDDLNASFNPGAIEICNGIDENCNGQIDDNCITGETVTIGNQIWLGKNLDVETYRDGTPIPQVTDMNEWAHVTTGAWCYYENNSSNGTTYGKLYNWYAVFGDSDGDGVKDKELAPLGWHVSTNEEFITLSEYLGGMTNAGGKMKSTGTLTAGTGLWLEPNYGATNSSFFTGLPGGLRNNISAFYGMNIRGIWWTSNAINSGSAQSYYLTNAQSYLETLAYDKRFGFSVRCVKN
jgi:uncharacterized protein (TIGR02145 family)